MREYEFVYIIQPDAAADREAEIHSRIDDFVSKGGGTYLIREDWGKRKLAYEIRKFQKGHYFQLNFLADGSFLPEIERSMRLDPDVLRFLTVQATENVADVEARVAEARTLEEEQQRRREEREQLEAERAEREAEETRRAAAAQAEAEAAAATAREEAASAEASTAEVEQPDETSKVGDGEEESDDDTPVDVAETAAASTSDER